MVNVFHGNAIAIMVVPYGKHSSFYLRVLFFKTFVANLCGSPILIEVFTIQVIIIIASGRNDIHQSVGYAHHLITKLTHRVGLCITIIPTIHQDTLMSYGSLSTCMCQSSPKHGLFAITFYQFKIMVGISTELFYHLWIAVGIFICTNVNSMTTEDGILTTQILGEE